LLAHFFTNYKQNGSTGAVAGKDNYGDVYFGREDTVNKLNGKSWQKNNGNRWSDVDTAA
jgi:hypothetical protein